MQKSPAEDDAELKHRVNAYIDEAYEPPGIVWLWRRLQTRQACVC